LNWPTGKTTEQFDLKLPDQGLEICDYSILDYKNAFLTQLYKISPYPDIERFKDLRCTFLAQATVGNKLYLLGGWTEGIARAFIITK
jgi:hypothetical protein